MKGDFHCHTKYSDGSLSLYSAARTAQNAKLDYLAVTDHDTVETFSQIDIVQPKLDVKLIKATELSAFDFKRNRKVHILCYLPQKTNELKRHCEQMCAARKECALKMARAVCLKYPIDVDDVLFYSNGSTSVFKQHIMHALADRGYTPSVFGGLFNELFDSKTGSCYLSCPAPDVYDVLKTARNSGGVVVFAHPGVYNSYELLNEVCEAGLIDGIEASHSRNRPGDYEKLCKIADNYGLIKTGGSDFHGFYSSKPAAIGCCTTDEDNINALLRLSEKKIKRTNI